MHKTLASSHAWFLCVKNHSVSNVDTDKEIEALGADVCSHMQYSRAYVHTYTPWVAAYAFSAGAVCEEAGNVYARRAEPPWPALFAGLVGLLSASLVLLLCTAVPMSIVWRDCAPDAPTLATCPADGCSALPRTAAFLTWLACVEIALCISGGESEREGRGTALGSGCVMKTDLTCHVVHTHLIRLHDFCL